MVEGDQKTFLGRLPEKKTHARRKWVYATLAGLLVLIALLIVSLVWHSSRRAKEAVVLYQGKPLEAWFFGSRTNFFSSNTRAEAIQALGTNAFPFLLTKIKDPEGSTALYAKAYESMPGWFKSRFLYPISNDDTRAIALGGVRQICDQLSPEQVRTLADCVPNLRNARLRMSAIGLVRGKLRGRLHLRIFAGNSSRILSRRSVWKQRFR
jgi:hypothetical protein